VKGFTYAEIAKLLEVSTHTVTTHVRSIYRKLEVHTRGEAVYEALQLGLVKVKE
jgi:DNA-binding NarL/FixJ family response regulator